MKLPPSNDKLETNEIIKEESFGIGNMGFILDILRNKMYKNPILAICREISTNARDAHREIGKPGRQIEIKLPNSFDSIFRVRDYGPGISPDRMSNVFIQYGNSTKRDSNVEHGGFGLGAKTPFAYSDVFTIVTCVDGIKYIYNAVIDETKTGELILVSKTDTEEENGTAIELNVRDNDFAAFSQHVINVTQHWDIKPKLFGRNPLPLYPDIKIIAQGPGWKLIGDGLDKHQRYSNRKVAVASIIIDGIGYDLEGSGIAHELARYPFQLQFGIGQLTLAANRDSIHWDNNSIELVNQFLIKIEETFKERIKLAIEKAETYPKAMEVLKSFSDTVPARMLEKEYFWNKLLVTKTIDTAIFDADRVYSYRRNSYPYGRTGIGSTYRYTHIWRSASLNASESTIIVNDRKTAISRKDVMLYLEKEKIDSDTIYIFNNPKKNMNLLVDILDAKKASDIFRKIRVRTPSGKVPVTISGHLVSKESLRYPSKRRGDELANNAAGGYYVVWDYKNNMYTSDKCKVKETYLSLLPQDTPVWAFTISKVKKLTDAWKPLAGYINEYTSNLEAKLDREKISKHLAIRNWYKSVYKDSWLSNFYLDKLDPKHNLRLIQNELEETDSYLKNNEKDINYLAVVGKPIEVADFQHKPKILYNQVCNQYPLLQYLSSGRSNDRSFQNALIDYLSRSKNV